MSWRRSVVTAISVCSLVMGLLSPMTAMAARTGSANCPTGTTIMGRAECIGYFTGADVYKNGVGISVASIINNGGSALLGVTNLSTYVSTMHALLYGSNANDQMGAAFIIDNQITPKGKVLSFGTVAKGVAYAKTNYNTWLDRVTYADTQHTVNWNQLISYNAPFQNSARSLYIQNDDIFYKKQEDETQRTIVFSNPDGSKFEIKKNCGNLVNFPEGLVAPPAYNLSPSVEVTDNNVPVDGVAQVGDTIKFTYSVNNPTNVDSDPTTCTIYGAAYTGFHDQPDDPEKVNNGGYVPPSPSCPSKFTHNTDVTIATKSFTATTANQTICSSLFVNPYKANSGELGDETCITVAAKPYAVVSGGDVAAGGGISTSASSNTCTPQSSASITSWNQNSGSFNGAGTQFAAMALGVIDGFATAQSVGNATTPEGLAFSNTTGGDGYGGSFGALPCIPDYYDQASATTTISSPINVSSLTSGAYKVSGNTTITAGGVVNPGNRIVIYVDGDVTISTDIKYSGGWTYDKVPLLEIVARGNINIAKNVSQLDGAYIAQPTTSGTKGIIYTCATAAGPYALDGTLFNNCNKQLTVNGLFSAYQVYLMRTSGTLASATSYATSRAAAAEVFNYNPALWIAQPPNDTTTVNSTTGKYDAITSLPPVL